MNLYVLNFSEAQLIQDVINKNRLAQKQLFEHYSPKMLSTCRQYIKDFHDAEDVMLRAFMKVFENIMHYRNDGSFEGWIRKIMIRESISFLRTKKQLVFIEDTHDMELGGLSADVETLSDYQKIIDELPKGCKYVFVLNVIEGYKHHEIADLLNISVGTSKSQLAYAKKILKEKIKFNR